MAIDTEPPELTDTDAPEPFDELAHARRLQALRDQTATDDQSRVNLRVANLADILNGHQPEETPKWLPTPDGRALIYPGRYHDLHGMPSSGKTWIALATIAQILNDGDGGILYIDWEDTPGTFVRRLQALGVPNPLIADPTLVTYINPQGPLGTLEVQALVDHAHHVQAALIVLDALAPALALDGLDENSNTDVTRWIERTVKPFLAQGHAVIGLDHIPKNNENRALGGRGAGAKRAVIDGASYEVMTVTAFSRNRAGEVKLRIAKDRPGMVGPVGAIAAHIHLDPTDDGNQIGIRIVAGGTPTTDDGQLIPTHLMERVSRHFEHLEPDAELSKRGICADVKGKNEYLRTAVDRLVEYGHLVADHSGTNVVFKLAEPYREPTETTTGTPDRAPAPPPRPAAPRAHPEDPRPRAPYPKGRGAPGAASEDPEVATPRPVDQTLDWADGDPNLWDDLPPLTDEDNR